MRGSKGTQPILIGLLLFFAAIYLSSCAGFGGVTGSGNVTTESREVSGFNEISLSGRGNLIIEQGNEESLRIEAE
ncbi:MAG TPA: hypothetical protein VE439_11905, partial [Anaerolineae bacterium]|nr:hypothetical protein [Anaerolineae bacterium]